MPTETLHFESARVAQQLYNNDPRNLQALEGQLGVKATSREGWIKLDGDAAAIDRAKHLFLLLENSMKAGTAIRNREFSHALNIVQNEGVSTLKDILTHRVITSDGKSGVTPKTVGQKKYLDAIRDHDVTFGIGPAGTGKTYLAVAMALAALREGKVSRIILTRPAVEAGEALGFLPGDLYEKIMPYLRPLHDALHDMLSAEEVQKHMERGIIEIAPLAYMRGRTLNHAFIILDEAQNSTLEQMFMFLTRLGTNSKAVVTGDETQIDLPLPKRSGLLEAHAARVEGIALVDSPGAMSSATRSCSESLPPTRTIAAKRVRLATPWSLEPRPVHPESAESDSRQRAPPASHRRRAAGGPGPGPAGDLGICLVSSNEMARLNETHLSHAGVTDVITFDYGNPSEGQHPACLNGEIFICLDEAVSQARRFRTSWESELARYVIHGLLHLTGYDDRRPGDRRRMKREENRLLRQLHRNGSIAELARNP